MRKLHFGLAAATAGAALLSVAAVHAQGGGAPQPPGKPDPSLVTAGNYTIDGGHSQVLFTYEHFGLTSNMGLASGATGTLTLDPKAPNDAKLSVDVPISSIHTTIAALDAEFQAKGWFDAATYPTAHFESTSVAATGNSARIAGNLTIKGITKPAVIDATFAAAGKNPFSQKETVSFKGTATINRSEFGLGNAVPLVSDAVKLTITVAFEK
ncbi:MAG: hypothetical protein H6R45_1126 [Proteobacteria bacterium]|nr:hypothetical protein [Pseudomonadota bacterium]